MRRRNEQPEGVRAYLTDRARSSMVTWAPFAPAGRVPGSGRFAALEAGEPVVVSGWELGPHRRGFGPFDRVLVDSDGGLRHEYPPRDLGGESADHVGRFAGQEVI